MGRGAPRLPPALVATLPRAAPSGSPLGAEAPRLPLYTWVYTVFVAQTVPVRDLRKRLARLLDDVVERRDHILVTRNGKPAAALVPIDEYEALEETAEILSDPAAIRALEKGLAEVGRGQTIELSELREGLAQDRS